MTALRPLVCAHRGASEELPDNSLAAFEAAIVAGAAAIETDVRADGQGRLVLAHDPLAPGQDPVTLAEGRIGLDLELKESEHAPALAAAVGGWTGWLLVTAFDPAAIAEVRRRDRRIRTGLLIEAPVTVHPVLAAQRSGANALLWADELATPTALRACADAALSAWTWTVNAPFRLAERLSEDGLEGVITDVPGLAVALARSVSANADESRA
ncbi:MAG: glycerophosphodiester phosphodiesterase [Actinomycetota bacterium]|nr:glycerophosphodiester phosphodiesterase [Actinomycetota bacterium]